MIFEVYSSKNYGDKEVLRQTFGKLNDEFGDPKSFLEARQAAAKGALKENGIWRIVHRQEGILFMAKVVNGKLECESRSYSKNVLDMCINPLTVPGSYNEQGTWIPKNDAA